MKHARFMKGLVALAVVLVWASLPVLAADQAKCDKKPCCPMMKMLDLSAEQQAKIMELCKSHREAVRALLNDEQKKKFDAMAEHMQGVMMNHECKMAAHECKKGDHKCSAECKCPCMKDGKCACVKKDGKCACPPTCPCMKDGKCTCKCGEGTCAAHAKPEGAPACTKTCDKPCDKKEKQE
jgi:hypothetical protein